MRILVIGGTRFVGLAMAREAIARGHEVELFHRTAQVPAGTESAKHLLGDRTADVTALQTGEWDVVLDVCGYRPHEINALVDVFKGRIGSYAFVSTISVYDSAIALGSDETAKFASTKVFHDADPITVEMSGQVYGPLKVLCEQAVSAAYDNHLIIRPTYVLGKEDYTNRFNKWVERIAAGGVVTAPNPADAPFQYIDYRDLAAFTVHAMEQHHTGPFHVAAPNGGTTYGRMLEDIRAVVGQPTTQFDWIDPAEDTAAEYPLWAGGKVNPLMALDTSRAIAAGLVTRPLQDTVRDIVN